MRTNHDHGDRFMNIGILCYASVGGSGIVATELAKALADRGHSVHLVSTDQPFRLNEFHPGLAFHQVNTPSYPLFREPQYLAVAREPRRAGGPRVQARSDPRALRDPACDGRVCSPSRCWSPAATRPSPRVVTTLHGTDITLVGSDPSYSEIVAFSIERSDGVTAVSQSLAASTHTELCVAREIVVIPNFLDCGLYRRTDMPGVARTFCEGRSDEARDPRVELQTREAD